MKYEDGFIKINLQDLIDELAKERRAEVIEALACNEELLNEVVNQVLDGWTTLGCHAGRSYGGDPERKHGIDGARMRIAKMSSEIAEKEIAELKKQIDREKALGQKGWDAYHEAISRR